MSDDSAPAGPYVFTSDRTLKANGAKTRAEADAAYEDLKAMMIANDPSLAGATFHRNRLLIWPEDDEELARELAAMTAPRRATPDDLDGPGTSIAASSPAYAGDVYTSRAEHPERTLNGADIERMAKEAHATATINADGSVTIRSVFGEATFHSLQAAQIAIEERSLGNGVALVDWDRDQDRL